MTFWCGQAIEPHMRGLHRDQVEKIIHGRPLNSISTSRLQSTSFSNLQAAILAAALTRPPPIIAGKHALAYTTWAYMSAARLPTRANHAGKPYLALASPTNYRLHSIQDTPRPGTMAPMTAEELLQHPEYNHTIWDLQPEQQGKVPVANGRGGPINIAYEVHGHGPRHVVVSGSTFGINIASNSLHPKSGTTSWPARLATWVHLSY